MTLIAVYRITVLTVVVDAAGLASHLLTTLVRGVWLVEVLMMVVVCPLLTCVFVDGDKQRLGLLQLNVVQRLDSEC